MRSSTVLLTQKVNFRIIQLVDTVHAKKSKCVTERIHNKIVRTKEDVQAYCQNAQT